MRSIVLLPLSIVMGIFVWQNLPSVTLIFFGGSMIARLPLAIWILAFTGVGLIGSLIVQLLSNLFRPSRGKVDPFQPSPSPYPKKPLESKRQENPFRPASSSFNKPPVNWPSQSVPRDELDDWDIESPPAETTPIRDFRRERIREEEPIPHPEPPPVRDIPDDRIQDTVPPAPPIQDTPPKLNEESIDYEVPQSPQNVSRTGSIYSYTYRESTKSQPKPTERVYDADFRVIAPPAKENTAQDSKTDDDEEEWV